jgi:hypothetical protein
MIAAELVERSRTDADTARKAARIVVAMMAKDLILSVSHERGAQRSWIAPLSDIVARRMISDSSIVPKRRLVSGCHA